MNEQGINWYTNITPTKPKQTPWMKKITADMIVKKELLRTVKKKGTGKEVAIYDFTLNKEFWQNIPKPVSVVLDEVHTIMNPRRSMSKINIICTDWLAMLRRAIGEDPMTEGDLYMITQLGRRVEIIGREMAHQIRHYTCHYTKECNKCHATWPENSEMAEKRKICPSCGNNRLLKRNHCIEVLHFSGMNAFTAWKEYGMPVEKTAYAHYFIDDIEEYFGYYNTHQWEDMFSTLY
jgi:hypothetical protein